LPRLFTPFERLGAECSDVEGCGIGLALSKRLIEAMGGVITVDSLPGVGSTFGIELPAIEAPENRSCAQPEMEARFDEVHLADGYKRTVLQIEDNLANRQVIERVLERRPHVRLLAAMQGTLGIELAREHRPDLILLDLHLPDLPGAEVLARLRADPQTCDIPVVVISADATQHQIQRLLAMGACEYLTKPFELPKLLGTLDRILESSDTLVPA
jgi:CheY-like chemotaxis protein